MLTLQCQGFLHDYLCGGYLMHGDQKPEVCVIGLGYIGLPTAAIIARANCQVTGIDVSDHVVDTINRGEIHIEEVDLDGLVQQGVVQRGTLRASTQIVPADVFVIAVPTPFEKDGQHTPDTSCVMAAATEVAGVLKKGDTIILESTCPVGTTEAMRDLIAGLRPDLKLPGQTVPKRRMSRLPIVRNGFCRERFLRN
jgi:UDP-N-acetyl-D-mannosaminuronic acid dehydrogenase